MHAVLAAQRAVREGRLDLEGRALDAGLFRLGGVHHLGRVAMPLRPAQVHPHQHLSPVGGVDATRAGRELDDRLALVVLPRQQGPHFQRRDLLPQRGQVLDRLGHQVLVAELECCLDVIDPATQSLDPGQVTLEVAQLAGQRLRTCLVVPQLRVGRLLFELTHSPAHAVDVEHALDAGKRGVEFLELLSRVGGHVPRLRGRGLRQYSPPQLVMSLVMKTAQDAPSSTST